MKILFKIWSVLMIIGAVASVAIVILAVLGSETMLQALGVTTPVNGSFTMILMIAMIPAIAVSILSLLAAIFGLSGNYDTCAKLALVLLIINAILFVINIAGGSSVSSSIRSLLSTAIYWYLAKNQSRY